MSNRTKSATTTPNASIEADLLRAGLAAVTRVVEARTSIPILSHILVDASPGMIALTGTDLEREVRVEVDADVQRPFRVTLPGRLLADIAKALPKAATVDVTHDTDKDRVRLRAGGSRFELATLSPEDYPQLTARDGTRVEIAAPELSRILATVACAMSTEETRYYLCGTLLHVHEGFLRAVATDGHRLALAETERPPGAEAMPRVIIPRRSAAEMVAMLSGIETQVALNVSDTHITLSAGRRRLASKLIDGTYPEYERIIPRNNSATTIVTDRQELARAIERVATVGGDNKAMAIDVEPDSVTLTARDTASSNDGAEELTDDITVDGKATRVGFNWRYFVQGLATFGEATEVLIALADPGSPALITAADTRTLHVLMPMRV